MDYKKSINYYAKYMFTEILIVLSFWLEVYM